ncbi:MAG: DUF5663 domain-containing protein [Patescibacteria group bacterium]
MNLTQLLNKELGLENLSQEEKEKIITRFGESLLKRIMFRIFQILSEQDRKNLEALQGGDEEKINQFLTEKIPDLEKIREEESMALMDDFKAFIKETK